MATHWRDIQQKTFTRWVNDYLSERGIKVDNLQTDLKDGLALVNLMEVLSGKKVGRYNKHPRIPMQKMENITLAVEFIKKEGIQIVNIGTDDIFSGNLRIILGLIWTLILRYEIKAGGSDDSNAANALLEWIRSKIPEYDIKGFTKQWNDGRAICALTNAMSPGLIPGHREKDPSAKLANATEGIEKADQHLGVDKLVYPDEMINPKVDKLAMMTYLAQFRNIAPDDIQAAAPSDASRCAAYGPGLVEGIAGEPTFFDVDVPADIKSKLEVLIEGPTTKIGCEVKAVDGGYHVDYCPTVPGEYKIHVTMGGEHIPGSIFHVLVLEQVSLGGEGKIRVFFSTTSSVQKTKKDTHDLEAMLTNKKVHLRADFEPWYPVDIMDKADRDAVFKKAGTRALPIVFIDDQYVGDYDTLCVLEEEGKLDELLAMKGRELISADEHKARMQGKDSAFHAKDDELIGAGDGACPKCGADGAKKKFCPQCGEKLAK